MKYLLGLSAIAAAIGLVANTGIASEHMPYEVTVTNNMEEELLAPVLVAPVSKTARSSSTDTSRRKPSTRS